MVLLRVFQDRVIDASSLIRAVPIAGYVAEIAATDRNITRCSGVPMVFR
jgi:hypothetical protein